MEPLKLRLYGNVVDRTWRVAEEPDPEPVEGDYPWMLLAVVEVSTGALERYPLDLEQ